MLTWMTADASVRGGSEIFAEAGLPLWLRPYEVIVTSANTALIETIPDAVREGISRFGCRV